MGGGETNYFALLGIDPDVRDWSVIEQTIEQRRISWSRDLIQGSPQRRREAERCLKLLPEITESLRDPVRRRSIADAAQELAAQAEQKNLDRFHAHVNEIRARGRHVDQKMLDQLAANFEDTMNRSEIIAQLRNHGITVGDGDPSEPAREWPTIDPSKMAEIADLLTNVGHPTLYAFLDLPPDALLTDIQDVVNRRYKQVRRDTTANHSVNELLGYCMDIFGSAEGKEKYDNALYNAEMRTLTGQLDAKGSDGILEEIELQEILSTALDLRVQPEFAADFIEDYAQRNGWTLTTDPGLVIQKLSTGETSPKASGVAEERKAVGSARVDEFHDYSTPLIVSVKDGQPIRVPPRFVNDRLVFDLHAVCVALPQSQFKKDWADLESLEDAADRGVIVFARNIELGFEALKNAIEYIDVPISTADLRPATEQLMKAEFFFQGILTTLEESARNEANREVVRQIKKAGRFRLVGSGTSGVVAAAGFNVALGVGRSIARGGKSWASSRAEESRMEKAFNEKGEQLREMLGQIMSTMVSEVVARLQKHGIEIDQQDLAQARRSYVQRNLKGVLMDAGPTSRIYGLKTLLAEHYYTSVEGLQGLFVTALQLDDWEAELERCASLFGNCRYDVMRLAQSTNLQQAIQGKLQSIFESPISTQQLKDAALTLKSHLTVGDIPTSPYDQRAWTRSGDDGSWKAACSIAISRSLPKVDPLQINSVYGLRRSLERANEGLLTKPRDVIDALDASGRISLLRRLIEGLAQQPLGDGDAAFLVEDIQLVERRLFTVEAAKVLQSIMDTASLSDVVEVTVKLQTWCAAMGEDIWMELSGKVDAKAVRTFGAERLKIACDQNSIEDLNQLIFMMTQIRGKKAGSIDLQNVLTETVDPVELFAGDPSSAFYTVLREKLVVERKFFTVEAAKVLQSIMVTASLSDVVEVTMKLQTWCAAMGDDVWTELAGKVDAKAVRTFGAERLKVACDQNDIGDLSHLMSMMTQICGEKGGSTALQSALVETIDSVLDRSQPIPIVFLKAVQQDLGIDDVEGLWASRAARKVATDVQRDGFELSSLNTMAEQLFVGDPPNTFYTVLRGKLVKRMVSSIDDLDSLAEALKELYGITGGDLEEVTGESTMIAHSLERSMNVLVDRCKIAGRIERVSDGHLGSVVETLRKVGKPVMIDTVFCWAPLGGKGNGAVLVTATGVEVFDEKGGKASTIPHEMMARVSVSEKGWWNQGFVFRDRDNADDGKLQEIGKLSLSSRDVAETMVEISRVMSETGIAMGSPWLGAFHAAQVMRGREYVVRLEGGLHIPRRILKGIFTVPRQKEEENAEGRGWDGVLGEVLFDLCESYSDKGVFSAPFSKERERKAREYICTNPNEKIFLIVDLTLRRRSNKKGIVLAESGIYWSRSKTEETHLPWMRFVQCLLGRDGDTISFGGGNEVNVVFGDVSAVGFYGFLSSLQRILRHVVQVAGDDVLAGELAGRVRSREPELTPREALQSGDSGDVGAAATPAAVRPVLDDMPGTLGGQQPQETGNESQTESEGIGKQAATKGPRTGDFVLLCLGALIGTIGWLGGIGAGLLVGSLLGGFLGLISTVYPIKALRIRSRKRALVILLLSATLFVVAVFLVA